jgi:hypothetical protein
VIVWAEGLLVLEASARLGSVLGPEGREVLEALGLAVGLEALGLSVRTRCRRRGTSRVLREEGPVVGVRSRQGSIQAGEGLLLGRSADQRGHAWTSSSRRMPSSKREVVSLATDLSALGGRSAFSKENLPVVQVKNS